MNSKYKDWIRKVEKDLHLAHCSYCMKEISIAGQGSKALNGHVMLQKHLKSVPTQLPLNFPTTVKSVDSSTSSEESKELKQQSIDVNVLKQGTLKLEIMWCTEVGMCFSTTLAKRKMIYLHLCFLTTKLLPSFVLGKQNVHIKYSME